MRTALIGYVRHLAVAVAPDAFAHIHADLAAAALRTMQINVNAHLVPAGGRVFSSCDEDASRR